MPRYELDRDACRMVVRASSSIHDTTTTWSVLSGQVEAAPESLERGDASADITVDMTEFDAGDWLKNRKLRKDFQLADHPRARFVLDGLKDIRRDGQRFSATATGVLEWRGRQVPLSVAGEGTLDEGTLEATGRFEFDIRDIGLRAPRILMIKVEDIVSVEIFLRAHTE